MVTMMKCQADEVITIVSSSSRSRKRDGDSPSERHRRDDEDGTLKQRGGDDEASRRHRGNEMVTPSRYHEDDKEVIVHRDEAGPLMTETMYRESLGTMKTTALFLEKTSSRPLIVGDVLY